MSAYDAFKIAMQPGFLYALAPPSSRSRIHGFNEDVLVRGRKPLEKMGSGTMFHSCSPVQFRIGKCMSGIRFHAQQPVIVLNARRSIADEDVYIDCPICFTSNFIDTVKANQMQAVVVKCESCGERFKASADKFMSISGGDSLENIRKKRQMDSLRQTVSAVRPVPSPSLKVEGRTFKIYVANLPGSITEEKLQTVFARYGKVISVTIPRAGKRILGFGFVEFADATAGMMCLRALDGSNVLGRPMVLREATENDRN